MFLSILDLESDCIHIPVAFKFHYDSINSASNEELHGSHRSSLNSIMFLLIRFTNCQVLYSRSYLNSIMFLLIPLCCFQNLSDVFDLNSIMFLLIRQQVQFLCIIRTYLNSIMFLLIHDGGLMQTIAS